MRAPTTALVLCIALLGGGLALAQERDVSGSYALEGRFPWWGERFTSVLTVSRRDGGGYDVVRTGIFKRDGAAMPTLRGTGRVQSGDGERVKLEVTFPSTAGAASRVDELLGNSGLSQDVRGEYTVFESGRITGRVKVPNRDGKLKSVRENGRGEPLGGEGGEERTPDSLPGELSDAIQIEQPAAGAYLAGQAIPVQVRPEGAELHVLGGPAELRDGRVSFTGAGKVWLQAKHGEQVGQPVALDVVSAQVTEVTVLDAIELGDAPPPHWRQVAGQAQATTQPAAILKDRPLRLRVRVSAGKDLSQATPVRLRAQVEGVSGGVTLEGQALLRRLSGEGEQVTLESSQPLSAKVAVNPVTLTWALRASAEQPAGSTPLRVYTTFAAPVDNPMPRYAPSTRQGLPLATKLHFELACTWANGASSNVGDGGDSICYQVDNRLRHHVAWEDYGGHVPAVPHYPQGTEPPINYDDLPGSVRNGERSVSPLYYPPLDVSKPYEEYRNYASNFGWWVLDNPRYTGGRCNQQASLICDVFGTLGIRAEVYYIERVARGKRTGRPMRRYYKSSRSDKSWNFHGQALAYLSDGSKWLYDGSGSWPPNRINGRIDRLMAVPNGPYIDYWNPWRYEDGNRAAAPREDWPDANDWLGVPLQAGEQYP